MKSTRNSRKSGGLSEEQGERFHQDITVMEERYQSRKNCSVIAEFS